MYSVKIIKDSVTRFGERLISLVATYPRIVHSEFLTHRVFSRNSASSRAIPIEKMIAAVEKDPFLPVWWGKNQAGMQAREEFVGEEQEYVKGLWLVAARSAVEQAKILMTAGLHKQIVNRVIEPYSWITTIITGTEWDGFREQRCHKDAQPEIKLMSELACDAIDASTPIKLHLGEWHLPFISEEDKTDDASIDLRRVSAARCARVSYLTHDGKRDLSKDMELFDKLVGAKPGHWSPLEHVATPIGYFGNGEKNLIGWRTLRFEIENK